MAYKKSCDRCGKTENWAILNNGFMEIYFGDNAYKRALDIKSSVDLCHECFEIFKDFMNSSKSK